MCILSIEGLTAHTLTAYSQHKYKIEFASCSKIGRYTSIIKLPQIIFRIAYDRNTTSSILKIQKKKMLPVKTSNNIFSFILKDRFYPFRDIKRAFQQPSGHLESSPNDNWNVTISPGVPRHAFSLQHPQATDSSVPNSRELVVFSFWARCLESYGQSLALVSDHSTFPWPSRLKAM